MKLTGTNRPITYTTHHPDKPILQKRFARQGWYKETRYARVHYVVPNQQTRCLRTKKLNHNTTPPPPGRTWTGCNHKTTHPRNTTVHHGRTGDKVTAVTAWGKRPVPSRTRKLRPTAPMVLHPGGCGRVGRRRTPLNRSRTPHHQVRGPPSFNGVPHSNWNARADHTRTLPHILRSWNEPSRTPRRPGTHPPAAPAGASGPDPRKVREGPDGTRRT